MLHYETLRSLTCERAGRRLAEADAERLASHARSDEDRRLRRIALPTRRALRHARRVAARA